ncbi:MAG TPA: hypothetical protein VG298_17525 [Acidimicrobiales bacterium]|jgi:hypothetical protein|nr:hypothetical protein [Acidimicrobiales bacterium]
MNALRRATRAFGHFWWDFLVGDTPELFFATVVIVVTALLLRHQRAVAVVLLPVMAIIFLIGSAYRGRRRESKSGRAPTS